MYAKLEQLAHHLANKQRIWVLTGAGISAPSGIPTYRDHKGQWQASKPIQHNEFIDHHEYRQRYWARSMVGWKPVKQAQPNSAHFAISALQKQGFVSQIVTQNVDRLHSVAGAEDVIDLHGRLDQNVCLDCNDISERADYQSRLVATNPELDGYVTNFLPDGDANVEDFDMRKVHVPPCLKCGGTLMPHVVFFGGMVPRQRVDTAFNTLEQSDCVLVVGSSLTVYSGFRFAKKAYENQIPLYAINQGDMRGQDMFTHVAPVPCETALPDLVNWLNDSQH